MFSSTFDMAAPRKKARTHDGEHQVHLRGERYTIDNEWKARVRAEMTRRKWEQKDLAEKLNVSEATISNLLAPLPDDPDEPTNATRQTRLVPRIHRLFGWTDVTGPVTAVDREDALRRITDALPRLSDADRVTVAQLVESLARGRDPAR